jgi:hypothetical protein
MAFLRRRRVGAVEETLEPENKHKLWTKSSCEVSQNLCIVYSESQLIRDPILRAAKERVQTLNEAPGDEGDGIEYWIPDGVFLRTAVGCCNWSLCACVYPLKC